MYVYTEFAQLTGSKHHTVSIERQETRQLQSYLKLRLGQLGPGDVITAVAQGLCSLSGFFFFPMGPKTPCSALFNSTVHFCQKLTKSVLSTNIILKYLVQAKLAGTGWVFTL